jgi:hypothetical protein
MITDQYVKDEFVSEILRRDIGIIYKTQEEVANRYFKEHTGTLRQFLSRRAFSLQESNGNFTVYVGVLSYLRFLDMQYRLNYTGLNTRRAKKQRANYAVYNRVVWGVLYNETFPDIQAGFTNEVRAAWRKQMEEALSQNKLPNEIK